MIKRNVSTIWQNKRIIKMSIIWQNWADYQNKYELNLVVKWDLRVIFKHCGDDHEYENSTSSEKSIRRKENGHAIKIKRFCANTEHTALLSCWERTKNRLEVFTCHVSRWHRRRVHAIYQRTAFLARLGSCTLLENLPKSLIENA